MARFDLADNPFVTLAVTPHSDPAQIGRAVDNALWDDDSPEHERRLDLARIALLTPKDRLDAELGFVLGLDGPATSEIIAALKSGTTPDGGSLEGLDRANLLAHRCRGDGSIGSRIRRANALVCAHEGVAVERVAAELSRVRRAAGFPLVGEDDLRAALRRLRLRHAETIVESLCADAAGLAAVADWTGGLPRARAGRRDFLEALLSVYEDKTAPRLEQAAAVVRDLLGAFTSSDVECLSKFEYALREWDTLAQPLQLAGQARGIDEPHSRELLSEIRGSLVDLANDQSLHEAVLSATRVAREVFAELPGAVAQLDEDLKILQDIVDHQHRQRQLGPLDAAVQAGHDNLDRLRNQLSFGCGERARPMVKAIFDPLTAIIQTGDAGLIEDAVYRVRTLALAIGNDAGDGNTALAITTALLTHAGKIPGAVAAKLREDVKTLRGNVKMGALTDAMRLGNLDEAERLADELIEDAEPELAGTLTTLKQKIAEKRVAKRRQLVGWGAVGAIVLGIVVFGNGGSSTDSSTYQSGSTDSYALGPQDSAGSAPLWNGAPAPAPELTEAAAPSDDGSEEMPPPYVQGALTRPQLRYCQSQKVRIQAAQGGDLDNSQIVRFNSAVDDFNARCSHYQYRDADMAAVTAEINSKRSDLAAEGRELVGSATSWTPAQPQRNPDFSNDWQSGNSPKNEAEEGNNNVVQQ